MNAYDIFVQGIGLVSLICSLLSFQQKKRRNIMLFQMSASLLFSLQLLLLGAYTGACVDFISFIRTLIFEKRGKYKWADSPLLLISFLFAMIISGIVTWGNIYSLLAILGSCLSTIALWMKSEKKILTVSLFVGPCWIAYNLLHRSYTGTLNEVLAMTSICIGLFRLSKSSNDYDEKSQQEDLQNGTSQS